MARRGSGFWRGVLFGLALGAAAVAALALLYPLPTAPPEIDESTLVPPGAPPAPGRPERPEPPPGLLPRRAPGPLIELPPPSPETASPSLVPGGDRP